MSDQVRETITEEKLADTGDFSHPEAFVLQQDLLELVVSNLSEETPDDAGASYEILESEDGFGIVFIGNPRETMYAVDGPHEYALARDIGIILTTDEGTVSAQSTMLFKSDTFKGDDLQLSTRAMFSIFHVKDQLGNTLRRLEIRPDSAEYEVESATPFIESEISPVTALDEISVLSSMRPTGALIDRLSQSVSTEAKIHAYVVKTYGYAVNYEISEGVVVITPHEPSNVIDERKVQYIDYAEMLVNAEQLHQASLKPQTYGEANILFIRLQNLQPGEI